MYLEGIVLSKQMCNVKIKLKIYTKANGFIVYSLFNLYHSLGWFSRQQIGDIFFIFPRTEVDISNPVFWGKYFKMLSTENFTQSFKC